ncbi:MAG: hypothetical protein ACK5MQ_02420 [Pikeienuella sp.]
MPETADALTDAAGAVVLDLDLGGLALLGATFDDTQIITRNQGALVQGRGGYAAFQTCGARWRLNRRRVNIRVADARTPTILRNEARPEIGLPAAISVAGADGRIRHRVQFLSEADWRVARAVEAAAVAPPAPAPVAERGADMSNVINLASVRNARRNWAGAELGDHLDDIIVGGGAGRASCLGRLGAAWARRANPGYLPSFLSFLCRRGVRFSASVPAAGMLQTLCGRGCECFGDAEGLMTVLTDRGLFSIDLAQMAQIWVTRHGGDGGAPGAALELYDAGDRPLAVLHADPWSEIDGWNGYLEAMP